MDFPKTDSIVGEGIGAAGGVPGGAEGAPRRTRQAVKSPYSCAHDGVGTVPSCLYALAFEALRDAVLLLTAENKIVAANEAARRLTGHGETLAIVDRELLVNDRAVASIIDAARASNTEHEGLVALGDGVLRRIRASPLPAAGDAAAERSVVCVTFTETDSAASERENQEHLLRDFRLTPSEAAVAGMLRQGRRVREIALARSVSEHTIRAQLKSLFAKLGVKSQIEAAALLHQLAVK
ncbi:MAG: PAS domain-containing protein [Hyphomonadaceae bacterium]|nr:PAS domain-containing protein [Hyphomonadaceae bacterium]